MIHLGTIVYSLFFAVILLVFRFWPGTRANRLTRVRKAGVVCFILLLVCLPLSVYQFIGFLCGWEQFGSGDSYRVVVVQKVFSSVKEMPPEIFWLWVVQQALNWFGGLMLLRLFWLYSKGIIFAEKNITCIRVQGYCLIISCLIDLEMHGVIRENSVSLNPMIYGLLIIFIAWVMDEGRKIQEEQELTV